MAVGRNHVLQPLGTQRVPAQNSCASGSRPQQQISPEVTKDLRGAIYLMKWIAGMMRKESGLLTVKIRVCVNCESDI